MTDSIYARAKEILDRRYANPENGYLLARFEDLVHRGVIDREGRVLKHMPSGPLDDPDTRDTDMSVIRSDARIPVEAIREAIRHLMLICDMHDACIDHRTLVDYDGMINDILGGLCHDLDRHRGRGKAKDA